MKNTISLLLVCWSSCAISRLGASFTFPTTTIVSTPKYQYPRPQKATSKIIISNIVFRTTARLSTEQQSLLDSGGDNNNNNNNNNNKIKMSKIEAARVKRFTIGYEKLCKSCPTRLQPRIDTLTEMILGLSNDEREQLMENVALRLKEEEEENNKNNEEAAVVNNNSCDDNDDQKSRKKRIRSARDVYEFQTTMTTSSSSGTLVEESDKSSSRNRKNKEELIMKNNDNKNNCAVNNNKKRLLKKLDKTRMKYEANKMKAARARRLLAVTNALLAKNDHVNEPTIYKLSNPFDNGWYHEIDELKQLSRSELKMERLKFNALKAKYDSKVAKARLKRYGTSVKLAHNNNRK